MIRVRYKYFFCDNTSVKHESFLTIKHDCDSITEEQKRKRMKRVGLFAYFLHEDVGNNFNANVFLKTNTY